ncbi:MAG TPA: isoaspartyl peptidase/L-asparaginase, partial [Prolixibacteraceae bacterium]
MKQLIICLAVILSTSVLWAQPAKKYALVIHGGAGVMDQKSMTPEMQSEYLVVLNQVLHVGDSVLANGGTCMDAVEKMIVIMEDSPLFNAGKG